MNRARAMTLIEVMICIAIVAIIWSTATVSWLGLAQLRREGDFRAALQSAGHQLRLLEAAPFETLPPQLLIPDRQGWIRVGQADLIPTSLRIRRFDSSWAPVEAREIQAGAGRVRVSPELRGVQLLVDYEWLLPDRREAELVEADGRVRLTNAPVVRVERVLAARGSQLEPVAGWKVSPEQGLIVPARYAGRAVLVDYLGTRLRNRARGSFLDEQLRPLDTPSPVKLLEISEDQGQRTGVVRLTTLRVNR